MYARTLRPGHTTRFQSGRHYWRPDWNPDLVECGISMLNCPQCVSIVEHLLKIDTNQGERSWSIQNPAAISFANPTDGVRTITAIVPLNRAEYLIIAR